MRTYYKYFNEVNLSLEQSIQCQPKRRTGATPFGPLSEIKQVSVLCPSKAGSRTSNLTLTTKPPQSFSGHHNTKLFQLAKYNSQPIYYYSVIPYLHAYHVVLFVTGCDRYRYSIYFTCKLELCASRFEQHQTVSTNPQKQQTNC